MRYKETEKKGVGREGWRERVREGETERESREGEKVSGIKRRVNSLILYNKGWYVNKQINRTHKHETLVREKQRDNILQKKMSRVRKGTVR